MSMAMFLVEYIKIIILPNGQYKDGAKTNRFGSQIPSSIVTLIFFFFGNQNH